MIPQSLDNRREALVALDKERKLVKDEQRVLLEEIAEDVFPLAADAFDAWKSSCGLCHEIVELHLLCGLRGLVVDDVVPVANGVFDQFRLPDAPAAPDGD